MQYGVDVWTYYFWAIIGPIGKHNNNMGGGGYPTAFHKLIKPDISKMKLVEKE